MLDLSRNFSFELPGVFSKTPHGQWLDRTWVQLEDDGITVTNLADVRFQEPNGRIHVIRENFRSDGASIPKKAQSFVGGPFSGKYRVPAMLHDQLLADGMNPDEAHRIFYLSMLAAGCDQEQADLFYAAVVSKTWWDRSGAFKSFLRTAWSAVKAFLPRILK